MHIFLDIGHETKTVEGEFWCVEHFGYCNFSNPDRCRDDCYSSHPGESTIAHCVENKESELICSCTYHC